MYADVGPPTGAVGSLSGAVSLGEKLTLPFPSSHKLPMYKPMVALLVKPPRMGLCQSFPHPCCDSGILAGFISCMSYACSHSYEFMYAKALTCLTKGPIPMQEIKHTCFATSSSDLWASGSRVRKCDIDISLRPEHASLCSLPVDRLWISLLILNFWKNKSSSEEGWEMHWSGIGSSWVMQMGLSRESRVSWLLQEAPWTGLLEQNSWELQVFATGICIKPDCSSSQEWLCVELSDEPVM